MISWQFSLSCTACPLIHGRIPLDDVLVLHVRFITLGYILLELQIYSRVISALYKGLSAYLPHLYMDIYWPLAPREYKLLFPYQRSLYHMYQHKGLSISEQNNIFQCYMLRLSFVDKSSVRSTGIVDTLLLQVTLRVKASQNQEQRICCAMYFGYLFFPFVAKLVELEFYNWLIAPNIFLSAVQL